MEIANIKNMSLMYEGLIILHRKNSNTEHLFTWNFLFCKKIEKYISCVETTRKIKII